MVAEALDRLRRDERVVEAESADELLDSVVADWYVDRQRGRANPTLARSSMMADRHDEHRELTRRALAMLLADGTLTAPALEVHGLAFRFAPFPRAMLARQRSTGRSAIRGLRNPASPPPMIPVALVPLTAIPVRRESGG